MSKSDVAENALLLLLFNNTPITLVGDAAGILGSAAAGNLYVGLCIADPGEGGNQTTNEAAYTNYARVAVPRTSGGWTVAGNAATNAAQLSFPTCGVTGATVTHFIIGTSPSGAGKLLYSGALTSPLIVNNNITPTVAIGAISTTED